MAPANPARPSANRPIDPAFAPHRPALARKEIVCAATLGFRLRRECSSEGSVDEDGCGRREDDLGEARATRDVARGTGTAGGACTLVGPSRAALLLAGPPARHRRQPPGRRQGAAGPLARLGGDRRGARRREGRLQGHRRQRFPGPARRLAASGPDPGLPPAPQPAEDRLHRRAGRRAARHQPGARRAVRSITPCSRPSQPRATTIGS